MNLTGSVGIVRSRTKTTELVTLCMYVCIYSDVDAKIIYTEVVELPSFPLLCKLQ
jgi:hypothetical protein